MSKKMGKSLFEEGFCRLFKEFGFVLVEGNERYSELLNMLEAREEPILILSREGEIVWASTAFEELFGFNDVQNQHSSLLEFVMPIYRPLIQQHMDSAARRVSNPPFNESDKIIAFRGRNGFGNIRSYELFFSSCWRNGSVHLMAAIRDISGNQDLMDQFKKLEENYSTLSETINESLIRIDEELTIVFANSAVTQTFGYTKEELIGEEFSVLFPPEIFERHREELKKYFLIDEEHRSYIGLKKSLEILGKHKRRGVSPMEMSFGNSSNFNGRTLTCIIRDITQQKNIERQLRKLAYHDKLTNLGNRDLFTDDVERHLQKLAKYPGIRGAVMFLDLDGFKQINDTLGHKAGDALLVETGGRLRSCIRESDSIYRFGGDEFVILLSHIHHREDAEVVAQKLLSTVRSPYYIEVKGDEAKTMVTIGVSIGIALFPDHGESSEHLVKNADLAMYSSKEAGKNRFSFYDESLTSKANLQLQIEQGIKTALHEGKLQLHYQPLVNASENIEGVEVLLRWYDQTLGQVSPEVFIPVVEEKGLIFSVGSWVLETACKTLSELSNMGYEELYVSFNVSPLQLEDARFSKHLADTIHRNGVDPSALQIEITESTLMQNPEGINTTLKRVKADNPGIKIAIDDFGTGYSSLSYLSTIPADSVKIDGSFVSGIHKQENKKIISTIIDLAESLQLSIVAEGVETKEQASALSKLSCTTMQGYYFSRPMPKEEFFDSLNQETLYA